MILPKAVSSEVRQLFPEAPCLVVIKFLCKSCRQSFSLSKCLVCACLTVYFAVLQACDLMPSVEGELQKEEFERMWTEIHSLIGAFWREGLREATGNFSQDSG